MRLWLRIYYEALDPKNGGVIEDISSEAKIKSSDKMPLLNSMLASVNEYNETRMGATIWDIGWILKTLG